MNLYLLHYVYYLLIHLFFVLKRLPMNLYYNRLCIIFSLIPNSSSICVLRYGSIS